VLLIDRISNQRKSPIRYKWYCSRWMVY